MNRKHNRQCGSQRAGMGWNTGIRAGGEWAGEPGTKRQGRHGPAGPDDLSGEMK